MLVRFFICVILSMSFCVHSNAAELGHEEVEEKKRPLGIDIFEEAYSLICRNDEISSILFAEYKEFISQKSEILEKIDYSNLKNQSDSISLFLKSIENEKNFYWATKDTNKILYFVMLEKYVKEFSLNLGELEKILDNSGLTPELFEARIEIVKKAKFIKKNCADVVTLIKKLREVEKTVASNYDQLFIALSSIIKDENLFLESSAQVHKLDIKRLGVFNTEVLGIVNFLNDEVQKNRMQLININSNLSKLSIFKVNRKRLLKEKSKENEEDTRKLLTYKKDFDEIARLLNIIINDFS